jgi:hypothetical protein
MLESVSIVAGLLVALALTIAAVVCLYASDNRMAFTSAAAAVVAFLSAAAGIEQTMTAVAVIVVFGSVLFVATGWCAFGCSVMAMLELGSGTAIEPCAAATGNPVPSDDEIGLQPGITECRVDPLNALKTGC